MHSPDLTQDNIARIRAAFPDCVTEARGEDGKLRLMVDFDQLKQALSDHIVDGPQERYRLDWPGKREALLTANAPIAKTLRPARDESVDFDTTKNLFIEGDNLDALKLLHETYLGKVKMIYIDPPYNTGNDFVYDDDFAESSEEYFQKSMQEDEKQNRLVANLEEGGRFHSTWLSHLYPRLKMARNLLEDDGLLAISIDDNEISNLVSLVDEVFGWENRKITCVKMSEASGLKMGAVKKYGTIPKFKEYVVLCSKNGIRGIEMEGIPKKEWDTEYNIFLEGLSKSERKTISDAVSQKDGAVSLADLDDIAKGISLKSIAEAFSKTGLPVENKDKWCFENSWRICQCATSASVLKLAKKKRDENSNDVFFVQTDSGLIYPVRANFSTESAKPRVQLIFADDNSNLHPGDLWTDIRTTGLDGEGGVSFKNGKKPLKLLKRLIQMKTQANDIVLDFYAGSGSSGHATLELNGLDGAQRRFILVQLPEEILENDEDQIAAREFCLENNLKPNIAEISKERIRRAGAKILEGECAEGWNKDVGFRVLKVDSSYMKDVWYTPDETTKKDLLDAVDNIKPGRSGEDLLFQVLLDWGVDLTLPIRRERVQGKEVFFVDDNALIACFESGITEDLVAELATHQPLRVVFRDTGFADDATKINVEQIFRQTSPETDVKAI